LVRAVINRCRDAVPEAPARRICGPIMFGTTANIGAATTPTTEAMLLGAGEPGLWTTFRRRESAAHPGRLSETPRSRPAHGPGENRRQFMPPRSGPS